MRNAPCVARDFRVRIRNDGVRLSVSRVLGQQKPFSPGLSSVQNLRSILRGDCCVGIDGLVLPKPQEVPGDPWDWMSAILVELDPIYAVPPYLLSRADAFHLLSRAPKELVGPASQACRFKTMDRRRLAELASPSVKNICEYISPDEARDQMLDRLGHRIHTAATETAGDPSRGTESRPTP